MHSILWDISLNKCSDSTVKSTACVVFDIVVIACTANSGQLVVVMLED